MDSILSGMGAWDACLRTPNKTPVLGVLVADEDAPEAEEGLVNVGPAFIAGKSSERCSHAKVRSTTHLWMPSRSFDSTPRLAIRCHPALTWQASATPEVISFVRVQLLWPPARPSAPPGSHSRDRIDQALEHLGVVLVRRSDLRSQWNPRRSTIRWCLLPARSRSVGFGPVCKPPFCRKARGIQRSTRPVQLSGLLQLVQQQLVDAIPDPKLVPALPGGASRVMPLPQPISWGRNSHWMPSSARTGFLAVHPDQAPAAFRPRPRIQLRDHRLDLLPQLRWQNLGPSLYILHLQLLVQGLLGILSR